MAIGLAGAMRLEHDGILVDRRAFAGLHPTLVFAALALERGRRLTTDALADVIWDGAAPPTWQSMVRNALTRVRRALARLGPDAGISLTGERGQHQLVLPVDTTIDVEVARAAVLDAEACEAIGDAAGAFACARRASSALQQHLLVGVEAAWVDRRREDLLQFRIRALEAVARAGLDLGDANGSLEATDQLFVLAPLREDAYRSAMRAHDRAGRRAMARQVYARCRRVLAEEVGCGPDPQTDALYSAILRGSDQRQRQGLDAQRGHPAA